MWAPVVGPFAGKEEADRVAAKVERVGKGWWQAKVQQPSRPDPKHGQWEVIASSRAFGNSKADVQQFAARLNRKGACRGLVQVKQVTDAETE